MDVLGFEISGVPLAFMGGKCWILSVEEFDLWTCNEGWLVKFCSRGDFGYDGVFCL